MLCNIGDGSRNDAQRILSLLCLSVRLVTVAEVIDALAVDIDGLKCYDSDCKLQDANDLSRICPELLEVINREAGYSGDDGDADDDGSKDEQDVTRTQIVRIAHFSVQEYLVSHRIKESPAKEFAVPGPFQHSQIATTCILYLCDDHFLQQTLTPDLVRRYPFARFTAQYWHHHYQQVDDASTRQLTESATALLTSDASRERWFRLHDPDHYLRNTIRYDGDLDMFGSALYFASRLGLDLVVTSILAQSRRQVNARGGSYENPLQVASVKGHSKVVQILIDNGADINAQGRRHYGNALQAASARGYDKIVRILLDHGADVNARRGYHGSALSTASSAGHEKIVQILIDNGADTNAQVRSYGNALQAAVVHGRLKIAQTLIENGADVNALEEKRGSALITASSAGNEKMVQMLIDNGADINAQTAFYGSPLQAAVVYRHERILQTLIANGADVNARKSDLFPSALEVASAKGYMPIVQLLVDAGACVKASK